MQHTTRFLAITAAATAAIALCLASPAGAKPKPAPVVEWFQYTVAFTCGESFDASFRVVTGEYASAVNLYNGNAADAVIRKNLALTFPPRPQTEGEVSDVIEETLAAGSALQVDCEEIQFGFTYLVPPPPTDYLQGFLVIESNKPLDVQAVYTALGAGNEVSIDVERVLERRFTRPLVVSPRVVICHYPPGNPDNEQTITIDAAALPAHQAHGDTLGACPSGGDDDDDDDDDDD